MTMNGFDTNLDGENEVYAVNTVAFHYVRHPVRLRVGELVRIYLVNVTEFDPVNSLHTHANFFHEYRTGTSLVPNNLTDITVLGQAERAILELFGGLAYSALAGTLFLAVGVGAIAEVVDELTRYARRRPGAPGALLAGAAVGFALMYGTALMIGA